MKLKLFVNLARLCVCGMLFGLHVGCGGGGSGGSAFTAVGPSGGTVTSSDGNLTLRIPAGALTETTNISISALPSQSSSGLQSSRRYQLEPDGLQFNSAVRVELITALAAFSGDDLGQDLVFLLSRSAGQTTLLGEQELLLDGESNIVQVSADLFHFSEVFDNLPRDGGVRLRFSGIPLQAPIGTDVFTATVTVTQESDSPIRSDNTLYQTVNQLPVSLSGSSGLSISLREDGEEPLGNLSPLTQQTLTLMINHSCVAAGDGAYGARVSFQLFDVLALLSTLGATVFIDDGTGGASSGINYTSRVRSPIRCGDFPLDDDQSIIDDDDSNQPATPEEMPQEPQSPDEPPTVPNTCGEDEKVCQNDGQSPGCLSCACDDGFPIGDCNATCFDTGTRPTQCLQTGCSDGQLTVCPG